MIKKKDVPPGAAFCFSPWHFLPEGCLNSSFLNRAIGAGLFSLYCLAKTINDTFGNEEGAGISMRLALCIECEPTSFVFEENGVIIYYSLFFIASVSFS